MLIELLKEEENIIGLTINTEEYFLQNYNENSFIVSLEDETLLSFVVEIMSPTSLKILFDNYIDTNTLLVKTKLFRESGEEVNFENTFVIHEAPTEPTVPTDPVVPADPTVPTEPVVPEDTDNDYVDNDNETTEEISGNTNFADDTGIMNVVIKLNPKGAMLLHQNLNPDISITTIRKYSLENYDDWYEEETLAELKNDKIEFEFEKDFIYHIIVNNGLSTFEEKFINGKPSAYFSSIKNIKQLSEKFSIQINNLTDTFELKLKIWSESKNALSYAGVNSVDIKNNDISLLNKYVTYKIFAFLLAKNLVDLSYDPNIGTENYINSNAATLKLDVLEISDSRGSSSAGSETLTTITSVLESLNKEITDIEYVIRKNFSMVAPKKGGVMYG